MRRLCGLRWKSPREPLDVPPVAESELPLELRERALYAHLHGFEKEAEEADAASEFRKRAERARETERRNNRGGGLGGGAGSLRPGLLPSSDAAPKYEAPAAYGPLPAAYGFQPPTGPADPAATLAQYAPQPLTEYRPGTPLPACGPGTAASYAPRGADEYIGRYDASWAAASIPPSPPSSTRGSAAAGSAACRATASDVAAVFSSQHVAQRSHRLPPMLEAPSVPTAAAAPPPPSPPPSPPPYYGASLVPPTDSCYPTGVCRSGLDRQAELLRGAYAAGLDYHAQHGAAGLPSLDAGIAEAERLPPEWCVPSPSHLPLRSSCCRPSFTRVSSPPLLMLPWPTPPHAPLPPPLNPALACRYVLRRFLWQHCELEPGALHSHLLLEDWCDPEDDAEYRREVQRVQRERLLEQVRDTISSEFIRSPLTSGCSSVSSRLPSATLSPQAPLSTVSSARVRFSSSAAGRPTLPTSTATTRMTIATSSRACRGRHLSSGASGPHCTSGAAPRAWHCPSCMAPSGRHSCPRASTSR